MGKKHLREPIFLVPLSAPLSGRPISSYFFLLMSARMNLPHTCAKAYAFHFGIAKRVLLSCSHTPDPATKIDMADHGSTRPQVPTEYLSSPFQDGGNIFAVSPLSICDQIIFLLRCKHRAIFRVGYATGGTKNSLR